MSGNGPSGWSKAEVKRVLLWPPGVACVAVAISDFRHGPNWLSWLVLVIGLSCLATLMFLEVRTVLQEARRPQ